MFAAEFSFLIWQPANSLHRCPQPLGLGQAYASANTHIGGRYSTTQEPSLLLARVCISRNLELEARATTQTHVLWFDSQVFQPPGQTPIPLVKVQSTDTTLETRKNLHLPQCYPPSFTQLFTPLELPLNLHFLSSSFSSPAAKPMTSMWSIPAHE